MGFVESEEYEDQMRLCGIDLNWPKIENEKKFEKEKVECPFCKTQLPISLEVIKNFTVYRDGSRKEGNTSKYGCVTCNCGCLIEISL